MVAAAKVLLAILLACSTITTCNGRWMQELQAAWLNNFKAHRRGLSLADAPESESRLPPLPGGFIYPVLAWGPNNQLAGMKEVLVLGRLLNRTVIVHDILNHYDDKSSRDTEHPQPASMDFSLVFDLAHLARHQSVVTLAEARAAGWDSRIEAVGHFGPKFLPQMKTAHALNVSDLGAAFVDFESFECTQSQLEKIARDLAPYKYVAFIVYENIVRDAGHGVKLRVTGELCHDEYLRVSGQLTKSDQLVALAAAFRDQRLGGGKTSFMAVHLRPYPDKCLHVWRRPKWDPGLAREMCKNPNLFNVFANQTLHFMRQHGLQDLFVMSYPELRDRIRGVYDTVGLTPVFYDEADLEAAVGYRSVSLLGMVEEEIAYEADVFVGTSYSSMTGIIMQERYARGKPLNTTSTFTKTA